MEQKNWNRKTKQYNNKLVIYVSGAWIVEELQTS